jgi:hypothetical protein
MAIFNNSVSRFEQQNTRLIGSTDCQKESAPNMLIGMLSSMGMVNPSGLQSSSSKGVKITKRGNNYTLTLSMYQPPIVLTWTGGIPMSKLPDIIEKLIQDRKKIGYMNFVNLSKGQKSFQFALAD